MAAKVAAIVVVSIVVAVVIIIGVILGKSFVYLDTAEIGIAYDTYTKELGDEVYYEGRHLVKPTVNFIRFPSVFQTLSWPSIQCLNEDGVTVTLSISFQYKIRPSSMKVIVQQFNDESGYNGVLKHIGAAAIQDICCQFKTTQLQAERGRFQERLATRLVEKFDELSTDVTDLQVNNINRPRLYENAIRAKESAREDIEVAHNEQPRLLTEARTTKREALSEADIIRNAANSDAKIMTNKAQSEGEAILNDYVKEAESYKSLKEDNGLDNEGFLAYMSIRAIANAKNPVQVGLQSPARTAFGN